MRGSISVTRDNAHKIDIGKCGTSFYPLVDYSFEKHTSQLFVKYHFIRTDFFPDPVEWWSATQKTKLPFKTDTVKNVHVYHLPSGFPCFKITFKFHCLFHLFMTCGIGERLEICRQNVFIVLGFTSSNFMHFQKSREIFYVFFQFFAIQYCVCCSYFFFQVNINLPLFCVHYHILAYIKTKEN